MIAAALHLRGLERDDLAGAHLALALGFITIAIPLRLDRGWITIGWLIEPAALLLIAKRLRPTHANVFRVLAGTSLAMGLIRIFFVDKFTIDRLILNDRALVYAMAIAIFAGIAIDVHRRRGHTTLWKFAVFALNFLALVELTMEVVDVFERTHGAAIARDFTWSALWMGYGAMLMVIGFQRRAAFVRWLALTIILLTGLLTAVTLWVSRAATTERETAERETAPFDRVIEANVPVNARRSPASGSA